MKLVLLLSVVLLGSFFSLDAAATGEEKKPMVNEAVILNAQAHYNEIVSELLLLSEEWLYPISGQVKKVLEQAKFLAILNPVLLYKTREGETLFETFIKKGKRNSTLILIEYADEHHLSMQNNLGKTIVHLLVEYFEDPELLTALYKKFPAVFEKADVEGDTPLHYAVQYERIALIPLLIQYAPQSITKQNNKKQIPAHLCNSATIGFFKGKEEVLNIKDKDGKTVQQLLFKLNEPAKGYSEQCVLS